MTAITNEHALALIALSKAETGGDGRAIVEARAAVAKHEAAARFAALPPEVQARVTMVTENIGTLLAHTHIEDTDNKKGRVRLVTDPDFNHLTFKERLT